MASVAVYNMEGKEVGTRTSGTHGGCTAACK